MRVPTPAHRLGTWALLALLLAALAGCSGKPSTTKDATMPDADDATGGLKGAVVDDEQRPLAQAEVALVEIPLSTATDALGRFSFRDVSVGDYSLQVAREGFEGLSRNITIRPDTVVDLVLQLTPLPSPSPYYVTQNFVGLQQCMLYTSVFLASCSYPYTAAYGAAGTHGVNLSQYGAPPDVMANKYRTNFSVGPNHTGIVSELAWTATSDAARYYVLQLSCAWYDPVVDDCVAPGQTAPAAENTYARARGVSPLRIEWRHEKPAWLPWVMARAYLSGPVDRPAGVALDQKIEMFNTVFYGAPVPPGWGVTAQT